MTCWPRTSLSTATTRRSSPTSAPSWHAAEVALGVLAPGYMPKREACEDMRALLTWADGDDDDGTWLHAD